MTEVELHTDGACLGNPGPGGWGCVLQCGAHRRELSGGAETTTNNRMELQAALSGLSALKRPCRVRLYSDSRYLVDAVNRGWLSSWQRRAWRKADRQPVLNVELWQQLAELLRIHQVTFHWVKGHADHPENLRCDELAVAAARRFRERT